MIVAKIEKKFKKDLGSLKDLFDFIEQQAELHKVVPDICFALSLSAEEIFTNLVKYNTQSRSDIRITMSRKKDRIILTFTDFNVEKYDINQTEKYDTHQPLKERPVGKLGIHMVKKLMDKVEYRYKNHNSTITLVKYVRDGYV